MICLAIWPLFRKHTAMLPFSWASLPASAAHYALLGVATAAVINAHGALQIVLTRLSAGLRWTGYAVAIAMVVSGVFTWQGVLSLLSVSGMALVAIGRMQRDAKRMRGLVLAGGPFWPRHDVLIASPVAIADAVSLIVGLGGQVARERLAQRRTRVARLGVSYPYATAPLAR